MIHEAWDARSKPWPQAWEQYNAKPRKLSAEQQTPWPEFASDLYRPSGRDLSAKLVPTFVDRGASRSQRGGSPMAVISVF
jgi:hypothetical protein